MPRIGLATVGLALLCSVSASAQSEPKLNGNLPGKFTISAGGLVGANLDTKLRIDSKSGNLGTTIDLESLLGLNTNTQSFTGAIAWRPHRRHLLTVGYYGLRRSNSKSISRDITIGDSTWTLGTTVTADMNTEYATLVYRWSPILTSRVSAGLSLVVPVVFASSGLTAQAQNVSAKINEKNSITVPIPLPGVHATARLTNSLYIDGHFQYLNITVFGIGADVINWAGMVNYYPIRQLGIAAGITGDRTTINGESGDWNGKLEYNVLGVGAYLTYVP
jgi:hypothetical protein